jgi:hypothetical protein
LKSQRGLIVRISTPPANSCDAIAVNLRKRQCLLKFGNAAHPAAMAMTIGGGLMNKKFLISWVVIFIAWMAGGFVVHVLLLGADYASAMPNLMRPEADQQAMFHWMLLARIITAGAFVWIYDRGNETKPWLQQGIRFGIAVALLAIVPVYLIYYVIQPISGMLVVKQILFDGTLMVILGVIVAFLNKPQAAAIQ